MALDNSRAFCSGVFHLQLGGIDTIRKGQRGYEMANKIGYSYDGKLR